MLGFEIAFVLVMNLVFLFQQNTHKFFKDNAGEIFLSATIIGVSAIISMLLTTKIHRRAPFCKYILLLCFTISAALSTTLMVVIFSYIEVKLFVSICNTQFFIVRFFLSK